MSSFERSMKFDLKNYDYRIFLLFLTLCRQARELLQSNLPLIMNCIVIYTQYYIQNFVKINLSAMIKDKIKKIQPPYDILSLTRSLLGYFNKPEITVPKSISLLDFPQSSPCTLR